MPDSTPWYLTGVPPMQQVGATMGQGVTPMFNGVDYTEVIKNEQAQAQANADRDYVLRKQQLDREYQTSRMTARTQQERNAIDRRYNDANVKLAQDRLAQEHQQYEQTFGEGQRQFNTTTGLSMENTLANLRGPSNYFEASNYARNIGGNPQTAGFLDALQNSSRLSGFGAQAGLPAPETGATLLAKLGGGGAGTGGDPNNGNYLAQIGNIAAKGAGQLAPGALENLTGTERDLFGSGLDNLGIDKATFLDQYARSRIGQGFSGSRAA